MDITFSECIKDLREAGFKDTHIARLCNCTSQHIGKLGKGDVKEAGFRIGRRLEKLHESIQ